MPLDRDTTVSRLQPRTASAAPALGANVLRFPNRRRRAYPRPEQMPALHARVLARMVAVYFELCESIGYPAASGRICALGWRNGLGVQMAPLIDEENRRRAEE